MHMYCRQLCLSVYPFVGLCLCKYMTSTSAWDTCMIAFAIREAINNNTAPVDSKWEHPVSVNGIYKYVGPNALNHSTPHVICTWFAICWVLLGLPQVNLIYVFHCYFSGIGTVMRWTGIIDSDKSKSSYHCFWFREKRSFISSYLFVNMLLSLAQDHCYH